MRVEVTSLNILDRRDAILRLATTNGLDRRSIGRDTLRVGEGIVGWVANARVPLAVRDVRNEPRFKWVSSVDQSRFTSMLSVPLVTRDEVVGVMNVQTVEARDFDRSEIDFLQTIANQLAGIIEISRPRRDSVRKRRAGSARYAGIAAPGLPSEAQGTAPSSIISNAGVRGPPRSAVRRPRTKQPKVRIGSVGPRSPHCRASSPGSHSCARQVRAFL